MVDPRPGMRIADVGAGTGFFAEMFAEKVGPGGRVYAVDIVPAFIELIRTKVQEDNLDNVVPVLCTDDSVELPPRSIDLAFICDTYHHFEYPLSTMTTLHEALVPGGEVVVVDFIRIPGASREWVINHVRAGQDEFIGEIESVGFELVERGDDLDFLDENYVMRFRKKS
jgi:ubiquinone/menaquinone biosynthesis C-methylase UbiE